MKDNLYIYLFFLVPFLAQAQNAYEAYSIGFYNVENLFDIHDDEDVRDTEFTPEGKRSWTEEKYQSKLKNMASVIAGMGRDLNPEGLSLLGVSEVENRGVLEDLIKEPEIAGRKYEIVHKDSPDRRGIDVGLIYNPAHFEVLNFKAHELLLFSEERRKYTRDVLQVTGLLKGEKIHVLVNHWPSRSGGEKKSAPGRKAAAQLNLDISKEIYKEDPEAKIIIMGDLNDDPSSASLKKVLNAKKKKEQVKVGGFFNPMYAKYQRGEGSNAWRDSWSLFDQVIVNHALLSTDQDGFFFHQAKIYKEPRMLQPDGRFKNYPLRTFSGDQFINGYSDHFPVLIYLLRKQ